MLFFVTALFLGIRHALEPDHLAAVSALVVEERRLWPAAKLGLLWGIGHLTPLVVIGLPLLVFDLRLPEAWEHWTDAGMGLLLVALGLRTLSALWRSRSHVHGHRHDGDWHLHLHTHAHGDGHEGHHPEPDGSQAAGRARSGLVSLGFGMLHGLAGSGGAAVLSLAAAPDRVTGVWYLLVFGLGTCLGMFGATLCLGAPAARMASRHQTIQIGLRAGAGLCSVVVGLLMWVP